MLSRSLYMGKKIEKLCAARTASVYREPIAPSMGKAEQVRCLGLASSGEVENLTFAADLRAGQDPDVCRPAHKVWLIVR